MKKENFKDGISFNYIYIPISSGFIKAVSLPSRYIFPYNSPAPAVFKSPLTALISVDLPQPLRPAKSNISPLATCKHTGVGAYGPWTL